MAMSLREQLRAKQAETERWIRAREAELRRGARELEARGRQAYAEAIQTGQDVLARTPSEVRALGLAAVEGRLPQAAAEAVIRRSLPTKGDVRAPRPTGQADKARATPLPAVEGIATAAHEVADQAGAALRGAVDEASFGLVDRASAGASALFSAEPGDLGDRYAQAMAEERAKDAYDARNFRAARTIGQIAGFAGSLAMTGGAGAAVRGGARILGVAPKLLKAAKAANATKRAVDLAPAGLTTLAGVGGASAGVGGQLVSDIATGELSRPGDYLAAAIGGAAGGLALRGLPGGGRVATVANKALRRPMVAGAVEGATSAELGGALDGRQIGMADLAHAGRAGAVGARIGDIVGKYGANAMSRPRKGRLGEGLSIVKSWAAGEGDPLFGQAAPGFGQRLRGAVDGPGLQKRIDLSRSYTMADHVTPSGMVVESKFGPYARLTRPQKRAAWELPHGVYRVDHWLPGDAGRIGAVGFGALATDLYDGGSPDWR